MTTTHHVAEELRAAAAAIRAARVRLASLIRSGEALRHWPHVQKITVEGLEVAIAMECLAQQFTEGGEQ